jgi:hypothetical protein
VIAIKLFTSKAKLTGNLQFGTLVMEKRSPFASGWKPGRKPEIQPQITHATRKKIDAKVQVSA